jgi:biopolymer transport protein ExbD
MKKSTLVTAMLVTIAILLVATGIMAQETKREVVQKKGASSPTAVVVVSKNNKLEFVREKSLLIKSMRKAFEAVREREVVKDIVIRSFEKANYLAVKLEDQRKNASTWFIDLVPVSEGSAYHTAGPHVVTCVQDKGCKGECIVVPPNTAANTMPSPECRCFTASGVLEPGHTACNFKINKVYIPVLLAAFNRELLAIGFEAAPDGSTPSEVNPKDKKPSSSPRPKN